MSLEQIQIQLQQLQKTQNMLLQQNSLFPTPGAAQSGPTGVSGLASSQDQLPIAAAGAAASAATPKDPAAAQVSAAGESRSAPPLASSGSGLPGGSTGPLQTGEAVEAQCPGWGPDWFPGVIRERLASGELQVLWDGDEPSVSNVPSELVRRRGSPPTVQGDAGGSSSSSSATGTGGPLAGGNTTAADVPDTAAAPPTTAIAAGTKRSVDELGSNAAGMAAPPEVGSGASAGLELPKSYRYDLRPGEDCAPQVANLRRRVEAELKDGSRVVVALHILRPVGRPEYTADPAPLLPATSGATAAAQTIAEATKRMDDAGDSTATQQQLLTSSRTTAQAAPEPAAVTGMTGPTGVTNASSAPLGAAAAFSSGPTAPVASERGPTLPTPASTLGAAGTGTGNPAFMGVPGLPNGSGGGGDGAIATSPTPLGRPMFPGWPGAAVLSGVPPPPPSLVGVSQPANGNVPVMPWAATPVPPAPGAPWMGMPWSGAAMAAPGTLGMPCSAAAGTAP